MTVHLHSVESFEGLLQRCRREGGVAVNYEKNTIFNEHSVYGLETRGPNLKSNFFLYRPRRCSDDFFILTEDQKEDSNFSLASTQSEILSKDSLREMMKSVFSIWNIMIFIMNIICIFFRGIPNECSLKRKLSYLLFL